MPQMQVHPWPGRCEGRPAGQPVEPGQSWPRAFPAAHTPRPEAVGSGRWPLVTCYGCAKPRQKSFHFMIVG